MELSAASVVRSATAVAFTAAFAFTGVASHAQAAVTAAPPQAPAPPASAALANTGEYPKVSLTAGRSTVLATDFNISRIAITNPAIADATVVSPREILIDGKAPGTISLIVWGPDSRAQYDLVVEQPVTPLQ